MDATHTEKPPYCIMGGGGGRPRQLSRSHARTHTHLRAGHRSSAGSSLQGVQDLQQRGAGLRCHAHQQHGWHDAPPQDGLCHRHNLRVERRRREYRDGRTAHEARRRPKNEIRGNGKLTKFQIDVHPTDFFGFFVLSENACPKNVFVVFCEGQVLRTIAGQDCGRSAGYAICTDLPQTNGLPLSIMLSAQKYAWYTPNNYTRDAMPMPW